MPLDFITSEFFTKQHLRYCRVQGTLRLWETGSRVECNETALVRWVQSQKNMQEKKDLSPPSMQRILWPSNTLDTQKTWRWWYASPSQSKRIEVVESAVENESIVVSKLLYVLLYDLVMGEGRTFSEISQGRKSCREYRRGSIWVI